MIQKLREEGRAWTCLLGNCDTRHVLEPLIQPLLFEKCGAKNLSISWDLVELQDLRVHPRQGEFGSTFHQGPQVIIYILFEKHGFLILKGLLISSSDCAFLCVPMKVTLQGKQIRLTCCWLSSRVSWEVRAHVIVQLGDYVCLPLLGVDSAIYYTISTWWFPALTMPINSCGHSLLWSLGREKPRASNILRWSGYGMEVRHSMGTSFFFNCSVLLQPTT